MKHRPITLIEVLQPQAFQGTPERARVTRTITQPEIDAFEQMEANAVQAKSALGGRRGAKLAPQVAGN
jgi:hypothetical protein